MLVFVAVSAVLIVASALGVIVGNVLGEYIDEKYLHYFAGLSFIVIGLESFTRHENPSVDFRDVANAGMPDV